MWDIRRRLGWFVPELKRLEADEARRVVRAFWRQPGRVVHVCALLSMIAGFNVLLAAVFMKPLSFWFRVTPSVVGGIAGGVVGGLLGFLAQFAVRRPLQRFVREYLIERGAPTCLYCGYDLRGQSEPRCPECGAACDPRFIQSQPDQRSSPNPGRESP